MNRYKATVHVSGAMDQHFYGTKIETLKQRAIQALTRRKPGTLNLWPESLQIFEQTRVVCKNRSAWKEIETIPYADIPEDQQIWRKNKSQ
jgi:hypothetical protein